MSVPAMVLLQRVLGGLTLALVAAVYFWSLSDGRWPPSHPWSGLTLTLLAGKALIYPVAPGVNQKRGAWVFIALTLVAAGFWAASARG